MPGSRGVVPLAALALVLAGCLLAEPASAATLIMGRGLTPWRIGQERVVRPSIDWSESHPENGRGCLLGLSDATRIDHYPYWVIGIIGGRVFDITTTRPGDRLTDGFVIGEARFRAVRARHPRAFLGGGGPSAFGAAELVVARSTGYQSFMSLSYWFSDGRLVALSTGVGGC